MSANPCSVRMCLPDGKLQGGVIQKLIISMPGIVRHTALQFGDAALLNSLLVLSFSLVAGK
eukprot:scaffold95911_cov36-Prasinocladus_malaysianus.AAC.1